MRRDRPESYKRSHGQRAALFGWAALLFCLSCTGQVSSVVKDGGDTEAGPPPGDGAGPLPDGVATTAELKWKSSQPHLSKVHALAADGNVLYVSADTGMYLYVLATQLQTRCSAPSGGAATPILAPATIDQSGNAFFTRASQQCLSSIDSGCNPRWDIGGVYFFDCKAASDTRPGLVASGSEVAVGTSADASGTAHLWGVKADDGSEAWHQELKDTSITRSLTVSQDGTVYVGTIQNGIGVLYTSQGGSTPQELFKAAEFHAPGVVVSNGNFVIGDWNKNLHAVGSGGSAVWKGNAGGRIISAPVEAGGVVLVAASLFGIYTHDLGGSASWNFKNTKVHYSGVAVDSAGNAYVGSAGDCTGGSTGGCVYAVRDGKLRWAYNTERPVEATPLIHNNLVLVGDEGGTLYGLGTGSAP
jgi:hypothetical protein